MSVTLVLYNMTVFPCIYQGHEASFIALSSAPMLLAQIPFGLMSGLMIADFLPDNTRAKRPQIMWFIFAVVAT